MLILLLIGYGNAAAPIAWRGACLGQKARRPLGEGRALRNNHMSQDTPQPTRVQAAMKREADL